MKTITRTALVAVVFVSMVFLASCDSDSGSFPVLPPPPPPTPPLVWDQANWDEVLWQ